MGGEMQARSHDYKEFHDWLLNIKQNFHPHSKGADLTDKILMLLEDPVNNDAYLQSLRNHLRALVELQQSSPEQPIGVTPGMWFEWLDPSKQSGQDFLKSFSFLPKVDHIIKKEKEKNEAKEEAPKPPLGSAVEAKLFREKLSYQTLVDWLVNIRKNFKSQSLAASNVEIILNQLANPKNTPDFLNSLRSELVKLIGTTPLTLKPNPSEVHEWLSPEKQSAKNFLQSLTALQNPKEIVNKAKNDILNNERLLLNKQDETKIAFLKKECSDYQFILVDELKKIDPAFFNEIFNQSSTMKLDEKNKTFIHSVPTIDEGMQFLFNLQQDTTPNTLSAFQAEQFRKINSTHPIVMTSILEKYHAISEMKNTLEEKSSAPSRKLASFSHQFNTHHSTLKKEIGSKPDTKGIILVKVIATFLSLGLAAAFGIWRKKDGKSNEMVKKIESILPKNKM